MNRMLLILFLIYLFLPGFSRPVIACGPPTCPSCEQWSYYWNQCVGVNCGGDSCVSCAGGSCQLCGGNPEKCCPGIPGWSCVDRCGGSGGPCCAAEGKSCCPGGSGSACCNPGVQGCCDGQCFDKDTQDCCGGYIYNKATQGCCGGGQVYNLATECCVNGSVQLKCGGDCCPPGQACCDGRACYNPSVEKCCGTGTGHLCYVYGETCCDGSCCNPSCCDDFYCEHCDNEICEPCLRKVSYSELQSCNKVSDPTWTQQPNGCSYSWENPAGCPAASFHEECDGHDNCYQSCGSDRSSCDSAFIDALTTVCASVPAGECREDCLSWAAWYGYFVEEWGEGAYEDDQVMACACCDC